MYHNLKAFFVYASYIWLLVENKLPVYLIYLVHVSIMYWLLFFQSMTLHTLLMVPEGSNISLQGTQPVKHSDKIPSQAPKPMTGIVNCDLASTTQLVVLC